MTDHIMEKTRKGMKSGKKSSSDEELLLASEHRFVLFPIRIPGIFRIYKSALAQFWTPEQVNLMYERSNFGQLRSKEKRYLKTILCSALVVDTDLATKLAPEVIPCEPRCCLGYFLMTNNLHKEMTNLLLTKYFADEAEQQSYATTIMKFGTTERKLDWVERCTNEATTGFGERVAAFAIENHIFNCSRLVVAEWLGSRGLTGLKDSNVLISSDIKLYRAFAVELWTHVNAKPNVTVVARMLSEAVQLESEALRNLLQEKTVLGPQSRLVEVTPNLMIRYLKYQADVLMQNLDFGKLYFESNPFSFMEETPLNLIQGFSSLSVSSSRSNPADQVFSLDADF